MSSRHDVALQKIKGLEQEIRDLKRSMLTSRQDEQLLASGLQALVVQAGEFKVALPVGQIEEVVPMVLVSPLPKAPAAVRGTISYRGQLVPVLDLEIPLSGTARPLSPEQFLVVLTNPHSEFALVIDQLEEVREFGLEDVDSSPVITNLPGFVLCVLRLQHQSLVLLDSSGLLAAGELDLLGKLLSEIKELEEPLS